MRILFVGSGYPPFGGGGTEVHMHQLASTLRSRGHEVSVFCRTDNADLEEYAVATDEFEGISVARVAYRFGDVKGFDAIVDNPRMDDVFRAQLSAAKPDLVHVHHLTGLSTGILDVVKSEGLPLVMTLHDFWMACPRGQRIRSDLALCPELDRARCATCLNELWPHFNLDASALIKNDVRITERLRQCDRLLTPSAFHREKMLELDLDPSKIFSVPHGLDHGLLPQKHEWRFPPKKIGFIGSVIPTKGVHILVEAMNRIGNPELECHIYGEVSYFHGDSGYEARLRELARDDLPFFFHGAYTQQDLPGIMADIDVLVVPSLWWESFCLTIREAMLSGVPVLASDSGAMHEALADLNLDMLFSPGDPQDLVHKLYALATDEKRFRKCGDLRAHVRTLEDMADDTEEHYRAVAGDPDRKRRHVAMLQKLKRKGTDTPYATVFVPTWNGGPLWRRVLAKILAQKTDFEYEVLVIDSGSKDGTLEVTREHSQVRLIEIPNHEFNHGLTRNRAVKEARGQIIALLTQDAEPIDENWLQSLVDNFDDPDIAGAYCHQLPRPDCNPFQMERLSGWTRGEGQPQRKQLLDSSRWDSMHPFERYLLIAFDDVASAVRGSVMEEVPYEKRQFGEDVAWGKAAILAGHTTVMDPGSVVIHSHNNSIWYEFKRVYLDHQNLNDLVGLQTVPSPWHVMKFSVKAWFGLSRVVWKDPRSLGYRLLWLAKTPWYAFTQNLAQFLGASSAQNGREGPIWGRIDRWLRKEV